MNDNASDPDLWLPVPSRAQHDEPISQEAWERRERARLEAEAVIAKAFIRERETLPPEPPQQR